MRHVDTLGTGSSAVETTLEDWGKGSGMGSGMSCEDGGLGGLTGEI